MDSNDALEKLLHSYERYYDISTENISAPFAAMAVFKSHNEQYFLIKEAKLSDIDSNEIVYFYKEINSLQKETSLSPEKVTFLAKAAWETGLEQVKPYYGHRNTDISLIILSDKISDEAFKQIKKIKFYKSYKFGFFGWSSFRLLACEVSTGRTVTNRRGSDLKKLAANLY